MGRAYLLLMMKMKGRKDKEGKEKKRRKEEKGICFSFPSINARTLQMLPPNSRLRPGAAHTLTHLTLAL